MDFLRKFSDKNKNSAEIARKQKDKTVQRLIIDLNKMDKNIWIPAVQSLAAIGDNRAVDPLFKRLQTYNDYNYHLLLALGAFKEENVARRIIALRASPQYDWPHSFWDAAQTALVSIGEPAVGPVSEELDKPEKEAAGGYVFLLNVLLDMGSPAALPAVKRYVQRSIDQDHLESNQLVPAAEYLSGQDASRAADILVNLLTYQFGGFHFQNSAWSDARSGVTLVTVASIEALGKMKAQVAIPVLEAVISHPQAESFEKHMAEKALASIRSQEVSFG